jgi:hypothetical protein
MSMDIKIYTNALYSTELRTKDIEGTEESQNKATETKEIKEDKSGNATVEISQEGRELLENSSQSSKKSGETSKREAWENNTYVSRSNGRSSKKGKFDMEESMRIDEPETYEKYKRMFTSAMAMFPDDDASEEEIAAFKKAVGEADLVSYEWFNRRCMTTGWFKDPAKGKYSSLENLETKYSTEGHDTSFNFYTTENRNDYRNSLWRYSSKFNVLISSNMLKMLDKLSDENKEDVSELLDKIDTSVNKMKEAEKQYEGNLEWLQFGVTLHDNGDVTYHANYKDCENEDGIAANSIEELLENLMSK